MCQDYWEYQASPAANKFISEKMAEEDKMQTIPFDPRFPNQNQTRNCWQNYVDFHRCQKIKVGRSEWIDECIYASLQGEEYEPCKFFEKNFRTVCPAAWIEKWDEQRDKVRFLVGLENTCLF